MRIACFASVPWDGLWQRHQQIMSRLAAGGHTVIYVEPTTVLQAIIKPKILANRVVKKDGVILVRPIFSPFHHRIDDLEKMDLVLVSRLFNKILASLGDKKVDVLWLFMPFFAFVTSAIEHELLVYDCADESEGFERSERAKRWIVEKEEEILEKADLVFVTSQRLYERCARKNANTHWAPNGVSLSFFRSDATTDCSDIEHIGHPVIGFVGALADWLDYEMLYEAASSNGDLSFVFVGPTHTQKKNIRALKRLRNVHLLGAKDYALIPRYIDCFDVCLIPFKIQPLTAAVLPIKLFEYFSAGKPVVSSPLDEITKFKDCLYVADSSGFADQIRKALRETNVGLVDKRVQISRNYSWESIVCGIERDLLNALECKPESGHKQRNI